MYILLLVLIYSAQCTKYTLSHIFANKNNPSFGMAIIIPIISEKVNSHKFVNCV